MTRTARAFTLLELVLVLAVLAVLSLIAVRSVDGLGDQTAFDATRSTMTNIEDAVLGPPSLRDADGTALSAGFVADLGRLPLAVGSDPSTQLAELWSNPRGLLTFAIRTAPSDATVTIGTGHRGDYLRLAIGRSELVDGWARPFDLLKADGVTPVDPDEPIEALRDRGADGLVDVGASDDYDTDLTLGLAADAPGGASRFSGTLSGQVYAIDANGQLVVPDSASGNIVVILFSPDPATGGVKETAQTITAPFTAASFTLTDVTIGPRVLRAYQGAGIDGANLPAAVTNSTRSSIVTRLVMRAGGMTKDLVLR
ncbi:MAG: prepilin-type N-terminal cleavage/methylation domain-containing protein [Planctomycetes bacterium]|nr:prepilin-type N-terminal cleavage/methylation domain-containing protein [Planctomycetota bacterium]